MARFSSASVWAPCRAHSPLRFGQGYGPSCGRLVVSMKGIRSGADALPGDPGQMDQRGKPCGAAGLMRRCCRKRRSGATRAPRREFTHKLQAAEHRPSSSFHPTAAMVAWAALVGLLSGCSLMGLSEDLEQSSCAGEPASFCGGLNQLRPTGDACQSWACDEERGVCAVRPGAADADGDGAVAAACTKSDVVDCDDSDAERAPGADEVCDGKDNDCDDEVDEASALANVEEICDGKDNDCDGIVDGGSFGATEPFKLFDVSGGTPSDVRIAAGERDGSLMLSYVRNSEGFFEENNFTPTIAYLDNATSLRALKQVRVEVDDASLHPFNHEAYEFGLHVFSPELFAGVVVRRVNAEFAMAGLSEISALKSDSGNDVQLPVSVDQYRNGFTSEVEDRAWGIAVAADKGQVLVAHRLSKRSDTAGCGTAEADDLALHHLQQAAGNDRHLVSQPPNGADVYYAVGKTRAVTPPVWVQLTEGAWILAASTTSNDGGDELTLWSVKVRGEGQDAVVDIPSVPLWRESAGEESADINEVQVALSPPIDDGALLAVSFRRGCGDSSRVVARVLRYRDGEIEAVGDVLEPEGTRLRHPQLTWVDAAQAFAWAWQETQKAIALGWISQSALLVRASSDVTLASDSDSSLPFGALLTAGDGRLSVIGYAEHGFSRAFWSTRLQCD